MKSPWKALTDKNAGGKQKLEESMTNHMGWLNGVKPSVNT